MSIDATQTGSGWTVEPIPSTGAGFTKNATTGLAETEVEGETFGALPLNAQGQAIGNIGHRRNTLANLIDLAGLPGEISIPTDYRGFIVHNGVAGNAYYVGPDSYLIDVSNPATPALVRMPRGFFSVSITGSTINSTITIEGGLQIGFGLNSASVEIWPIGSAALLVKSPFESNALAIDFAGVTIDFTGSQAGKNYFDLVFDSRGALTIAAIVNSATA